MNDDKIQRAIEFLLKSQADFDARQKEMRADMQAANKEMLESDKRLQVKLDNLSETVRELAVLGRNLVQVAEMHSRRLDGLEGLQSH